MLAAIYVHQTRSTPYADNIVKGKKTIETRTRNTLARFVGQRVLIIRTMAGREPEVVGSVFVSGSAWRSETWLCGMRDQTLIPPGSRFDCKGDGKWCYWLTDAAEYGPFPLRDFPVVSKNRTFAMIGKREAV